MESIVSGLDSILVLIGALALTLGLGTWAGIKTSKSTRTWYAHLRRPSFNPPNWVFAPVWTTLYIMMSVAAWLVWREAGFQPLWLGLYLFQLALNIAWSFIFFEAHRPGLSFLELLALWVAIIATTVEFFHILPWAGLLMLPYLAWSTFAAFLNYEVWRMNRL